MIGEKERSGFPFVAAFLTALAGGIIALYIYLALTWRVEDRSPYVCSVITLSGGLLGLLLWVRSYLRSREAALSACLPWCAFLIPGFFFPDYFAGQGQSLTISGAILAITIICFYALRLLIFTPSGAGLEGWVSKNSLKIIVAASFVFIIVAVGCGIARYYRFAFSGADLGVFIQSFWTALHGKLFWNTHEIYPGASRFGKQFSPVMFLILPFFGLFPHAITLFVLDAVAIGLGGCAMYFLARDSLGKYAGVCFALSFLMYPAIAYAAFWAPYYFMHYAPIFLILALFFFNKEKLMPFCLFLCLACSAREDVALTAFMFGIYAMFKKRKALWVLTPMVMSAAWFGAATGIIIPALGTGTVWEFYGDLGGSFGGIIFNIVHRPLALLPMFFAPDYLKFIYLMFMPLGLILPIMGSEIIFALPTLVIIGLASMDQTRSIYGYYYMPLIPFMFACSMTAVKRITTGRMLSCLKPRERVHLLCTFLFFLSLAVFVRGPLAETLNGDLMRPYNVRSGKEYNETLRKVMELVPPEASVFTPRYLMPHLAKRMFVVFVVPYDAEYLIVDSRTTDWLTAKIQKNTFIETLDGKPDYVKLFDENGVKLYKRGQD